jgi:hypothetical protein
MPRSSKSKKRDLLISSITELVERSALLREKLERYETSMITIRGRLEQGDPALDASRGTAIPAGRRQVTEGIEEFEAARHQLRLALFAVGKDEGATISDVGRVLGISRQLASRLAAEVARKER